MAKQKGINNTPSIDYSSMAKSGELRGRILFTLLVLVIFRIGSYIPLPGIDSHVLSELVSKNSEGILGMFNMLSGGSLGRMSIFALSIMPYITASIIMQLVSVAFKDIEVLKKEGEQGRKKINQYTRIGTIFLAIAQGLGIAISLENMAGSGGEVVVYSGFIFRLAAVSTLVGGTAFMMWLGEQISARGIGNGISLIIFSGIVAGLPNSLAATFDLGKSGALSPYVIIFLMLLAIALVVTIVYFEKSNRKIIIQYPKRQVGNKLYGGENSFIPLKINTSGVIPPIFASSILLFPLTIANFASKSGEGFLSNIILYLGHGKPLYICLLVLFIIFFSFFYTAIIFNPDETAENLKKYGAYIPGRRPGKHTAEFLDFVLTRITVLGSIYLSVICALPEVIIANYSVPFYLGGTSILIVVNVVMDTMVQVQTHLFSYQYDKLIKKVRFKK
jgi:preprotein translocase subunit SecY